jgi:hypothetical protein
VAIADRRRSKVEDFVRPQLEQGEQIKATVSFAWTGMSPWLMSIVVGYFIGYLLGMRMYALVVTDRRVIYVQKTFWLGRPKVITGADPLSAVRVTNYKPPGMFGKLELSGANGPSTFWLPRIHKAEGDAVFGALGDVTAAPPPLPPPTH